MFLIKQTINEIMAVEKLPSRYGSILLAYYAKYRTLGNIKIDQKFIYNDKEVNIGNVVRFIRQLNNNGELDLDVIKALNHLGFVWRVNKALGDTWEPLRRYFKMYKTLKGISSTQVFFCEGHKFHIGTIISRLRRFYKDGKLTQDQIEEFESMGIEWDCKKFEERILPLKAYYEIHHNLNIPHRATFEFNGELVHIGQLIYNLRRERKRGEISPERIAVLDAMDMIWEYDRFEPLKIYYQKHGSLYFVDSTMVVTYKGKSINLGGLASRLRSDRLEGKLDPEEIEELDNMDFRWEVDFLEPLREYKRVHGTIANIKREEVFRYKNKDFAVGNQIVGYRVRYKRGELPQEMIEELNEMGIVWKINNSFKEDRLKVLRDYYNKFQTISNIRIGFRYNYNGEDIHLGTLINNLRVEYKLGILSEDLIKELNEMGMIWKPENMGRNKLLTFEYKLKVLNQYMIDNDLDSIENVKFLEIYRYEDRNCYIGRWLHEFRQMRQGLHKESLTEEQIDLLDKMGICWVGKKEQQNDVSK